MKTLQIIMIWILGVFAAIFVLYALFGFADWIFSDPFNWINYEVPSAPPSKYQADVDKCRAIGNYPTISSWDGHVISCTPYTK